MIRKLKKVKLTDIIVVIVLIAGIFITTAFLVLITGYRSINDDKKVLVSGSNADGENKDTAIVYNRNTYAYKKGITNILILGIDGEGNLYDGHSSGDMGQSDAIYLMSIDSVNKKISLIGIPRDTMTSVSFYEKDGTLKSVGTAHIAVQYAYGKDIKDSVNLISGAVSSLLYNIQIDRVVVLSINSIAIINDAIGGVDVTIENDFTDESGEVLEESFIKGNTVHLMGDSARIFVQERDCNVNGSAMDRLSRQEQYFSAFIPKAKSVITKDIKTDIGIYNTLKSKGMLYTDMSFAEIMHIFMEVSKCGFISDDIKTVAGNVMQGKVMQGKQFEEYYPDYEKLRAMVMETFYTEVTGY